MWRMSVNGSVIEDDPPLPDSVYKAAASSPMVELGVSGLVHFSGYLYEEDLPQLQGLRGIRTYKEMGTDPVVGGVLLAIDNMVRRVEWTFDPAEDSGAEGQRWADFATTCLHDMSSSWSDTISTIFTMVQFGWSLHETVYKRRNGEQPDRIGAPPSSDYDDGLVGWRKIDLRSQDSLLRWEFAEHGALAGMWQQVLGGPVVLIPIERSALFRTSAPKGSPEGHSVLRAAYRPFHFKRRMEEIEGIGIERDLVGLPVAGVPSHILDAATRTPVETQIYEELKRILPNLRRGSQDGVIWPTEYDDNGNKLYELSLMSTGGRRQFDIDAVIARKNQEIAICALADWLLLGHENVGSKALGSSKIDLFTSALETWTNGVADVFNAHVTPRLLRMNGVSAKLTPQLVPGRVSQPVLVEFATAMAQLVRYGAITNNNETENWTRGMLSMPALPDDVVETPQQQAPTTPNADTSGEASATDQLAADDAAEGAAA